MSRHEQKNWSKKDTEKNLGGSLVNASNPSPAQNNRDQPKKNQLLDEKAEKYIRESGNIEDMPDPQEQQDADEMMKNKQQQQNSTRAHCMNK